MCPDAHDVVRILVISLNRTRMYLALRSFSTVKLKEKFLNLFWLRQEPKESLSLSVCDKAESTESQQSIIRAFHLESHPSEPKILRLV